MQREARMGGGLTRGESFRPQSPASAACQGLAAFLACWASSSSLVPRKPQNKGRLLTPGLPCLGSVPAVTVHILLSLAFSPNCGFTSSSSLLVFFSFCLLAWLVFMRLKISVGNRWEKTGDSVEWAVQSLLGES